MIYLYDRGFICTLLSSLNIKKQSSNFVEYVRNWDSFAVKWIGTIWNSDIP